MRRIARLPKYLASEDEAPTTKIPEATRRLVIAMAAGKAHSREQVLLTLPKKLVQIDESELESECDLHSGVRATCEPERAVLSEADIMEVLEPEAPKPEARSKAPTLPAPPNVCTPPSIEPTPPPPPPPPITSLTSDPSLRASRRRFIADLAMDPLTVIMCVLAACSALVLVIAANSR